jgi:L-asparaginase / beta-aspartyl-peptidase
MLIPAFLLLNDCARAGREAGLRAIRRQAHPLDVVETVLREAEGDGSEPTVGTGGHPNLVGSVELDAGLMDGRHRMTGGVAALQGFLHPISVARQVMERLPHALLVGNGAARFAKEIGAETGRLLTGESEAEWQTWLAENLTAQDWTRFPEVPLAEIAWRSAIPEAQRIADRVGKSRGTETGGSEELWDTAAGRPEDPRDTAIVLAGSGTDLVAGTSTSGWAYKYPGRVGDSALPGCGYYADAVAGAAACTHTGEMAIRAGTARRVVLHLEEGRTVEESCRAALLDLRRLERGFLDELVIHAADPRGNHCVATTGIPAWYWWWREGMDQLERRETVRL